MEKGNIYIISGPIGNLEDITLRAIEVIKEVDLILSEDTRETQKVLEKYGISKPQISYRDQNHNRIFPRILEMIEEGKNLGLMSDSGTPLISDPGFNLVREAIEKGINVISIPGPSAVISALAISGLPTDKFSFLGFLPKSKGQQKTMLEKYGELDATLVIYESPFRIEALLTQIYETLGNRKVCVAGELTKVYEKINRGPVLDVLESIKKFKPKGEYVVLVAKKGF